MPTRVTFANSARTATDAPGNEAGEGGCDVHHNTPTKVECHRGDRSDESHSSSPPPPMTDDDVAPTTATTITTIVDEAQECLAQSNLMFLYADLRLLSATGRINTRFESLCIDSDMVPKTTSAEIAQLVEGGIRSDGDYGGKDRDVVSSISPVQIMAILFVELRQEVIAQRRRAKYQLSRGKGSVVGWVHKSLAAKDDDDDDEDDDVDDGGGLLDKITDREGRKRLEMDMHANIRTYNDMLASDLRGMPSVRMDNIVQNALRRVGTNWFGRSAIDATGSRDGASDDDGSGEDRGSSSSPGRLHLSSIFGISSPRRSLNHSHLESIDGSVRQHPSYDLPAMESKPEDHSVGGGSEIGTSGDGYSSELPVNNDCVGDRRATPQQGRGHTTDPPLSMNRSSKQGMNDALKKHITTIVNRVKEDRVLHHQVNDYEAFAGAEDVGNKVLTMTSSINRVPGLLFEPGRNMSENELLDFMTKCIESRDSHSLDFMADFFYPDTVAHAMVKSEAQFVWLQDWFPIKDCIYAISVDKKKKRVVVVFRGAITRADWSHAFDSKTNRCENPVSDSYVGKGEYIRVHRGFYKYLFRIRKDTSTTKYDEIATKVYEYGNKLIGSEFSVAVNGYSLGGALSLLFGFFASTDNRFTRNGPVRIFTYGMPLMAGNSFADAFRHQEMMRKVQHARFYNSSDIVPHVPLNLKPTKRGSRFVHVGIDVKLYPIPRFLSLRGNRHPHIYYNDRESAMGAYWTAIKNNAILNMPLPWRIKHVHALPEHRKRLARAVSKADADKKKKPFLHGTLDEAYEDLVYKKKGD